MSSLEGILVYGLSVTLDGVPIDEDTELETLIDDLKIKRQKSGEDKRLDLVAVLTDTGDQVFSSRQKANPKAVVSYLKSRVFLGQRRVDSLQIHRLMDAAQEELPLAMLDEEKITGIRRHILLKRIWVRSCEIKNRNGESEVMWRCSLGEKEGHYQYPHLLNSETEACVAGKKLWRAAAYWLVMNTPDAEVGGRRIGFDDLEEPRWA